MTIKKCGKCKLELDTSLFNKNKGFEDGYHFYCKKCRKPMDKAGRERTKISHLKKKQKVLQQKNVLDVKKLNSSSFLEKIVPEQMVCIAIVKTAKEKTLKPGPNKKNLFYSQNLVPDVN